MKDQINALKVRVFDAEEALREERKSINDFMQKLVDVIQPQADENGGITVNAIMQRAEELVAKTTQAPSNSIDFPTKPEITN